MGSWFNQVQQYIPNRSQRDWHIWIDDCWWLSVPDPKKGPSTDTDHVDCYRAQHFDNKLNPGQNYFLLKTSLVDPNFLALFALSTRVGNLTISHPIMKFMQCRKACCAQNTSKRPLALPWGPGFYLTKPGKRKPQALKIPPIVPPSWSPKSGDAKEGCKYCKRLVS